MKAAKKLQTQLVKTAVAAISKKLKDLYEEWYRKFNPQIASHPRFPYVVAGVSYFNGLPNQQHFVFRREAIVNELHESVWNPADESKSNGRAKTMVQTKNKIVHTTGTIIGELRDPKYQEKKKIKTTCNKQKLAFS